MKIGLIGIGRLGSQIAKYLLLAQKEILAYHQDKEKAENFCREYDYYGKIEPTNDIKEISNTDVVILTLPSEVTLDVARTLKKVLKKDQWVINTATEVYLTELKSELSKESIVAAKIIGNAYEIEKGEKPGIVLDGHNEKLVEKSVNLFSNLGYAIKGDEKDVSKINKIGAIEAIRTVLRIEKRLDENNIELDDEMYNAFLNNVVAGTVKTYSMGNIGPFLEKVITQLKKETLR
ncbi:NAD(P)-binding domain-containing protein [Natranaerofaba carboxydovora]|uniref:NAD(P)-binding domain-containing protein n=1 Tax=Natranaerofaba carboxydovora TaxID=2742683 RepID=UPI001F1315D7|nr:NAD(P)-binding domain-containing protein [Natranaerofaba carboxydovora]UMZ73898.1 NADP oxidoreductase coenzyme F420-dependent [Natranaerofaba carboxydovora]